MKTMVENFFTNHGQTQYMSSTPRKNKGVLLSIVSVQKKNTKNKRKEPEKHTQKEEHTNTNPTQKEMRKNNCKYTYITLIGVTFEYCECNVFLHRSLFVMNGGRCWRVSSLWVFFFLFFFF